jgi:lysophospholipase L1-like esterase
MEFFGVCHRMTAFSIKKSAGVNCWRLMHRSIVLFLLVLSMPCALFAQAPPVRIILVGDSTVAPGNGWGPGFCADVTAEVTCLNMAKNGRSTNSYRSEGLWKDVLAALQHNAEFSATWVFIQFGHNDQPGKPMPADPATEFPANMRRYAGEVRETGAYAVLITPLTRRTFKDGKLNDTLEPWAAATKRAAAAEKVPVLDLNAESAAAVQKMGPVEANKLAMTTPPQAVMDAALQGNTITVPANPPTTFDYTHLGERGSVFFGRMVADDVRKTIPELRRYVLSR